MICAMTARRILPGRTDEFMETFMGSADTIPEEIRDRLKAVYACRQVDDPDVILTFGMFDGTLEEMRMLQAGDERHDQMERIEPFVEETLFTGSFEMLRDFVAEADGVSMGTIGVPVH